MTNTKNNSKAPDIETMRHSFSHVLAMAVQRIYPNTRLGIGPVTKNGFYYDFEFLDNKQAINMQKIEEEMHKIIEEEIPFQQIIVDRDQAFMTLSQLGQIYKTELLQTVPDDKISFFKTGEEFIDLCRGPHVKHTGQLGVFKLIDISKHHWMDDEKRPELDRIEGIAFENQEAMEFFFSKEIDKKEKNHLILGPSLNIFTRSTEKTNNIIYYWLNNGITIRKGLLNFFEKQLLNSKFSEIKTPIIRSINFRQSLFDTRHKIYSHKRRSYKDLPLKFFEFGSVFEKSTSQENGLYDSQEKTEIQAYSYCEEHMLQDELAKYFNLMTDNFNKLEIDDIKVDLCIPDLSKIKLDDAEKRELNKHFQLLKNILEESGKFYKIITRDKYIDNEPYISFTLKDINENEWPISRLVIRGSKDKRNQVYFSNSRNNKEKAQIISAQIVTSLEALVAYLIESTNANLPVWLSPIQVSLLSISQKYNTYLEQIEQELKKNNIRVKSNTDSETIQSKIRQAQKHRIPYMLILGEKEINTNSVSVRNREGLELGLIRIDEFIDKIHSEQKEFE